MASRLAGERRSIDGGPRDGSRLPVRPSQESHPISECTQVRPADRAADQGHRTSLQEIERKFVGSDVDGLAKKPQVKRKQYDRSGTYFVHK